MIFLCYFKVLEIANYFIKTHFIESPNENTQFQKTTNKTLELIESEKHTILWGCHIHSIIMFALVVLKKHGKIFKHGFYCIMYVFKFVMKNFARFLNI